MANINSLFEVRKSGDQEVAVRFPKGIEIGDNLDATALLKGMLELALHEEPDVVGILGEEVTVTAHCGILIIQILSQIPPRTLASIRSPVAIVAEDVHEPPNTAANLRGKVPSRFSNGLQQGDDPIDLPGCFSP